MQLSGITEWLNSVRAAGRSVADWTGNAINAGLADFRAKVSAFNTRRAAVRNLAPAANWPADLRAEYARVNGEATDIADRIAWIESQVRAVFSGFTLSGLGAVPIIPAAVVAAIASVAYLISKWTDSATRYIERAQYIKAREQEGGTASQAIVEFNRQNPAGSTGLFADAASLVWPLAIGAGILYLMKNGRR